MCEVNPKVNPLFTKTFVNKVVCSDILTFFWHATLEMVWAREPRVFPQKNSSSNALPNGKNGARNTFFFFIVVFFYSTGHSSSSDVVFYSIGYCSLSLIKHLNDISLWYLELNKKAKASDASYAWASIVVHCLCEIIIQNWIRFKTLKGPVSSIQLLKTSLE